MRFPRARVSDHVDLMRGASQFHPFRVSCCIGEVGRITRTKLNTVHKLRKYVTRLFFTVMLRTHQHNMLVLRTPLPLSFAFVLCIIPVLWFFSCPICLHCSFLCLMHKNWFMHSEIIHAQKLPGHATSMLRVVTSMLRVAHCPKLKDIIFFFWMSHGCQVRYFKVKNFSDTLFIVAMDSAILVIVLFSIMTLGTDWIGLIIRESIITSNRD